MKLRNVVGGIAAVMLGLPGAAQAAEIVKTENASVNVGGRLQLLGFGQRVDDPDRSNGRIYMFMKQARINAYGNLDNWKYRAELAFGGEVELNTKTGFAPNLLDLWVDAPLPLANTYIRAGQFKTLFSRERLNSSGDLLFGDRSVQNLMFRQGRDVGVVLHTKMGPLVAGAGVATGGGLGIPQRYLPQIMGTPMVQARVGLDFGTGENAFTEKDENAKVESLQGAFFVDGFYMKDSQIGHSTVLTTKFTERPLLINTNWNPYLAQAPRSIGTLQQVGFDGTVASPAGPGVVKAEIEGNYGAYKNDYGEVSSLGARVQVGYGLNAIPLDITARYAAVLPSDNFVVNGTGLTAGDQGGWSEFTPSLTYRLAGKPGGFNARLVADLPIQMNTPVVREVGIGSYLLAEQPDQAAYVGKGANTLTRQTVIEARMMFQAEF